MPKRLPVGPDGYSWCSSCKKFLPIATFGADKRRFNGLKSWCQECIRKHHNDWLYRTKGRKTRTQYDLDRAKIGPCAVCDTVEPRWEFRNQQLLCKACYRKRNIRDWWKRKKADPVWLAKRRESVNKTQRKRRKNPVEAIKMIARSMVSRALRAGIIHKSSCEICGSWDVEADHRNYAKPLEVRWFCREHHGLLRNQPTVIIP